MTSSPYSADSFFQFIDFIAEKNLVKVATARNWRAAAIQLFSVLGDDEKDDLRNIDVDQLVERFANARGMEVAPKSLTTYRSRYNSGYNEFISWVQNKTSYTPSIASRRRGGGSHTAGKKKKASKESSSQGASFTSPETYIPGSHVDFPIPIRDGHIVIVRNLPHDLTSAEAEKICGVIKALGLTTPKE